MSNAFLGKLTTKWDEGKFVCVGLDSADFALNQKVIDATFDLVCAYKPNSAFYEAEGIKGLETLKKTVQYIKEKSPEIPIILDAKRGDIGNTNEAYVVAAFNELGVDAITVHPYLGKEALQPFLDRTDKGIIILVKTSNPGAGEFQDLEVEGKPLYQVVAEHVREWNTNGNCAVVVGATYPEELKIVREIIGDAPILVPGVGTQGGDLSATLKNGLNSKKQGLIINSSRGIILAPDPREAALTLHSQIQEILKDE
ncbi:orotidine-5'-phosphate decarboxylase [Candidatus Daviesbacteria bacterium]|nr:orotidine-5'-phosphate decarboxylase [Candidatus Daviesbacteria bacterium]